MNIMVHTNMAQIQSRDGLLWDILDYAIYLAEHPILGLVLLAALVLDAVAGAIRSYLIIGVSVAGILALCSLLFIVGLVTPVEETGVENILNYALAPFVVGSVLAWWTSN